MSEEVKVITESVRDEAKKWRSLADQMEPVKQAVHDMSLAPEAFFIGDANILEHHSAYCSYREFMEKALTGAVVEFEQIGRALDKIADAYDNADNVVTLDLNKIYSA
ncbi:hypothetical protein [Planosporangium mesophilum]|uniref:Uncharacterized protein n=1 Tax=Planosporangium mesophilum TaxID=689768 RepID=A0A8J3TCS7_9ACTN|nr:hypothetical protein [Planosporangium mesophilum]NJC84195.1 hypothetical protein [Planosporangium mesophilum]GII23036.1 hypothetical protein Pme01_26330 [Planosporangium mesophilum]